MTEKQELQLILDDAVVRSQAVQDSIEKYKKIVNDCRKLVADDVSMREIFDTMPIAEGRKTLTDSLDELETVRRQVRVASFQAALDEGLSVADCARAWGVSRQLVSRILQDASP